MPERTSRCAGFCSPQQNLPRDERNQNTIEIACVCVAFTRGVRAHLHADAYVPPHTTIVIKVCCSPGGAGLNVACNDDGDCRTGLAIATHPPLAICFCLCRTRRVRNNYPHSPSRTRMTRDTLPAWVGINCVCNFCVRAMCIDKLSAGHSTAVFVSLHPGDGNNLSC